MERAEERLKRLNIKEPGKPRMVSLEIANLKGITDEVFVQLATAVRLKRRNGFINLSAHRFENLSRGRGWARKGKGPSVEWAERGENGGYNCTVGTWVIGGNDGFSRKGSDTWKVSEIRVGDELWLIAN